MCGIVGYVGEAQAPKILLDSLAALEYRGYDSVGIALRSLDGSTVVRKTPGKLGDLMNLIDGESIKGKSGIGHTRWATHGIPNQVNAHPHLDCSGFIAVVHNGIVENYIDLRNKLIEDGHNFVSDTDSEVIPHLLEGLLYRGLSFEESVQAMANDLKGSNSIILMYEDDPNKIVALRMGNAGGVVIGYGDGEMIVASDLPAVIPHTRNITFLENGEMAIITSFSASYKHLDGTFVEKAVEQIPHDYTIAAKEGYQHFMLKEISEQPQASISTLRGRVNFHENNVSMSDINLSADEIKSIERVIFVGMGTSYHACLIASHMMEQLAGILSQAEDASEFRYRNPILGSGTLVVSIGQSGETADTLAAMERAQSMGSRVLTLVNVEGSQASRMADGHIYLRAGPEIGVASTKTFVCSLEAVYLLALYFGFNRGLIGETQLLDAIADLEVLPNLIASVISDQKPYIDIAKRFWDKSNFLYLGRGVNYPVALEGALKMKEISYIHAEGSAGGGMKHGPIALVDDNMTVVAIATRDYLYDKMLNNISEVKARGGTVIAITNPGCHEIEAVADHVVFVPPTSYLLSAIVNTLPMQLFAYHIALEKGCDVDQPRNLAKSVTVE